jgi:hypothetical protein
VPLARAAAIAAGTMQSTIATSGCTSVNASRASSAISAPASRAITGCAWASKATSTSGSGLRR